jgi:hypothetical protein
MKPRRTAHSVNSTSDKVTPCAQRVYGPMNAGCRFRRSNIRRGDMVFSSLVVGQRLNEALHGLVRVAVAGSQRGEHPRCVETVRVLLHLPHLPIAKHGLHGAHGCAVILQVGLHARKPSMWRAQCRLQFGKLADETASRARMSAPEEWCTNR